MFDDFTLYLDLIKDCIEVYQNEEIEIHFGIKEELRSGPDSLKKAIVLKEILDKPLSLRTSPF